MTNKILWIVTGEQNDLLAHAKRIEASAVAIRTDNHWLRGSIAVFHAAGIKVYGWRWPGVRPTDDPPNYYAPDQANYVANVLIPAGLDGYIADIESDGSAAPNRDWNNRSLAPVADKFSSVIKNAGRARNPNFLFGVTSGFDFPTAYPHIPWDSFLAYCDAVYPQVYWRGDGGAVLAGGTAQSAYTRSWASWKTLELGAIPIVPIIGQIANITPQSIGDFGTIMKQNQMNEVHFYTDVAGLPDATYATMASL
jgi:hypothetical protein